jgi:uncharacterized protein (TIGR01777 family)
MAERILITGGTGMVGTHLSDMLIDLGYEVAHLSRKPDKHSHYRAFRWDIESGYIDEAAFQYADCIVHLAGASVAEGKWTKERKREIMESRVASTSLLYKYLSTHEHHISTFIAPSAVGIYGDAGAKSVGEETEPAHDFLAEVCQQWEAAEIQLRALGIRTPIFRIGLVLSDQGGALPSIAKPIKMMTGAALGSGEQWMSWIHIDDLCRLFIEAIENETFTGTYNAVSPNPVTNDEFTHTLANVLDKPLVLPHVPAFALKLVLGEMADVVLASQRVSADRILQKGFRFEYPELKDALESFYAKS